MADHSEEVLATYIAEIGAAPKAPNHLRMYSEKHPNLPTLSYPAARAAILKYEKEQRGKSNRASTPERGPPPSAPDEPALNRSVSSPPTSTQSPSNKYNYPKRSKYKSKRGKSGSPGSDTSNIRTPSRTPPPNKRSHRGSHSASYEIQQSYSSGHDNDTIIEDYIASSNHSTSTSLNHKSKSYHPSSKSKSSKSSTKRKSNSKTVIIDNGTAWTKMGFVGDAPENIHKFSPSQRKNKILKNSPIDRGIITDFIGMEGAFNYGFKHVLHLSNDELSETAVILNSGIFNPQQNAEDLCELLFESFNISKLYLSSAAVLSLYGAQKVSGLVLESGAGLTQCVPIWNGCPVAQACKRLDVGGNDIDEYLFDLLSMKGTIEKLDIATCRQIKEQHGYIALDYRKERAQKIEYQIPNGRRLQIGDERFKCGELLFSYLGSNSIEKQIYASVMTCDASIRKELLKNIVISGGSMMMHGMEERLKNDLKAMCLQSSNKKIRKYAEKIRIRKGSDVQSWMGASIWATKMAADDDWFTREQWKEHGSLVSSKIENANVFFYDDYSPKEVNLKEIQDYNQQYRKRTVSVYSHKNSVSSYHDFKTTTNRATASSLTNSMKRKTLLSVQGTDPFKFTKPEPTELTDGDEDLDDDQKEDVILEGDEADDQEQDEINEFEVEEEEESTSAELHDPDRTRGKSDGTGLAIQSLLNQIEELQLENSNLKEENESLKQQNKEYKYNERKLEAEKAKIQSEKAKLESFRKDIQSKSQQFLVEMESIKELFKSGNEKLQNLDLSVLAANSKNKVEPITD